MTNQINFLGACVYVGINPKIGVCNGCRAVLGEVDTQTGKLCRKKGFDIHHELYDFNNVLAYTLELCPTCHGRYNAEQGIFKTKRKWKDRLQKKLQFCRNYEYREVEQNRVILIRQASSI
jgi:hypothetical protein